MALFNPAQFGPMMPQFPAPQPQPFQPAFQPQQAPQPRPAVVPSHNLAMDQFGRVQQLLDRKITGFEESGKLPGSHELGDLMRAARIGVMTTKKLDLNA